MTTSERDLARYATDEYREWNRDRMQRMRLDPVYREKERDYANSWKGYLVQLRYEAKSTLRKAGRDDKATL
jgi:hypothetical protein